ncbi:MAG: CehA/McbA family metallohydrolase [Kofleriaceae bacterium]
MRLAIAVALVACGATDTHVQPPSALPADANASVMTDAAADPVDAAVAIVPQERWLRGSTHVHARPSGDSSTPIPDVIRWYETHGYDFIVLTDHNRVSEVDPANNTGGKIWVSNPPSGLIVLAGMELTHNPNGCLPQGVPTGKCRIHVNVIGATARPGDKLDWADRRTKDRVAKYRSALAAAAALGGIAQLNHPQWFWGMTTDVLVEVARHGMLLYEVANTQFMKWQIGDKDHPSAEQLWDAALARGAKLWAVASDDAHDYDKPGKYPAGGGWIAVWARRDPQSILDAITAGRFYASTGVVLEHAEVDAGELVVASADSAQTIELIENGKLVATVKAKSARRTLPASGYLRAVVTRSDGAKAWTQPVRR